MTQIVFIRHASCAPVGVSIAGRTPGVRLDDTGRVQALALVERLPGASFNAIYTSPLERAVETAQPLAAANGLTTSPMEDLNEIDFGDWTGMSLDELAPQTEWQRFNAWRSLTRIPGGETMAEAQTRGVRAVEAIRQRHPNGRVAVVSHADLIRCILAYYLGMPIDHVQRLEVAPASLSILEIWDRWVVLRALNVGGPLALE
jgi:probable phosphomutase (TIGR03848 family)